MSFRKVIPVLIFLSGALFGKPIALEAIGLFVKAFLYCENGWRFSYRSIDWHEGKLSFSEVEFHEPAFSLRARSISLLWKARHLKIEQPIVTVKGIPDLRSQRSDWTIEIERGILSGETFGTLNFCFEKTWRHHLGRLVLEKHGSKLIAEAIEEGDEIGLNIDLHQFDVRAIKHWIDCNGILNGRMHFNLSRIGLLCKRGSLHLDFEGVGHGQLISSGEGTLDWEGELWPDIIKTLETAKFRLKLANLNIQIPHSKVEGIKGEWSSTAGVGGKWEFGASILAAGQQLPMTWSGKAFLHALRPHWMETEIVCLDAKATLCAQREDGGFRWKGEGHCINATVASLAQSFGSLIDSRLEGIEFEQGVFDVEGDGLFGKTWTASLRAENLRCQRETAVFECRAAKIDGTSEGNGQFQLSGVHAKVSLETGNVIEGEEWRGVGEIQQGVLICSHFEGMVAKRALEIGVSGKRENFHLQVSGQEGKMALQGAFEKIYPARGIVRFEIEEGNLGGLDFKGSGWIGSDSDFSLHVHHFNGPLTPLLLKLGLTETFDGCIQSVGVGFQAEGNFSSYDWFVQAKGQWRDGICFHCPFFEKRDELYSFDVRVETPTWELVRFNGTAEGGICKFNSERTQLLGEPLRIDSCTYDLQGLVSMQCQTSLSWKPLITAVSLWFPQVRQWTLAPLDGAAIVDFVYFKEGASRVSIAHSDFSWDGKPVSVQMSAIEERGGWHIEALQVDQCLLSADIQREESSLQFIDGKVCWKERLEADFFGRLDSSLQFECHLPFLRCNLGQISPLAAMAGVPLQGLDGIVEGKGMIVRHTQGITADVDFTLPSGLKAAALDWQNLGPIHLSYASDTGILCSGLHLKGSSQNVPEFACNIGLLQFDSVRSLWAIKQAQFRLPPHFVKNSPLCCEFDLDQAIEWMADLECPSDLSSLSCHVERISIFCEGALRHIEDLSFSFDESNVSARFLLGHQGYPIKVFFRATRSKEEAYTERESIYFGRLVLEDGNRALASDERPLSIDWVYASPVGLLIREIGGKFAGVDASFHALDEGLSLIGSARVDFNQFCKILPPQVAQVFTDLKMGNGYELKGKLSVGNRVSFRGLFSGKQIDLFGYQLRTLLAQCELDLDKIRLSDLKISDSAGMLKIDELIVSTTGFDPWTISIPHLVISELRPSLLQRPGRGSQPAGPLVVRELKIDDFKGFLEDSKTYTARGELSFINSFRREHTLFDIPSDFLGRIVGLDLELLIPACGSLQYQLKDRFFYLTSLENSFSEAQRSEFFLVSNPAPTMDLDGNLHIFVSMKQFVLFKLTESFQIFIDGKLDDPQFHLKKKRRFLGL